MIVRIELYYNFSNRNVYKTHQLRLNTHKGLCSYYYAYASSFEYKCPVLLPILLLCSDHPRA